MYLSIKIEEVGIQDRSGWLAYGHEAGNEAKLHQNKAIVPATAAGGGFKPIKSLYQQTSMARLTDKLFGSGDYHLATYGFKPCYWVGS